MTTVTKTTGRGWAYAGALLGGAVSVAANVAHSYVPPADAPAGWHPHGGAVVGAVFWPFALFVAVEIFARIAWPAGRRWTALRFLGLLPVALVAAVVSYRHLSGLLAFYREDALTSTIGPLAVDGLMVMATGALIATGARRANLVDTVDAADTVAAVDIADRAAPETVVTQPTRAQTSRQTAVETSPAVEGEASPAAEPAPKRAPRKAGRATTATAVARLRARHPDLSAAEIAKRLKVSDRTVRRHLSTLPEPIPDPTAAPLAA
jgi:hypothetical protein